MRGYVDTAQGQIHYRRAGRGGPNLLLFHQWPLSSVEFERALPLLATRFTVLAFDLPGHGGSDPPPEPIAFAGYVDRLWRAVEALAPARFVVAGAHTGAGIALEIALRAGPARATHAVFSGIPILAHDLKEPLRARLRELVPKADGSHLAEVWKGRLGSWGADTPAELLHLGAVEILRAPAHYHWAILSVLDYDPRPSLGKLGCPALFLNGKGDALAGADAAAARIVDDGRLELVPGGALLAWRDPERYAAEIIAFAGDAVSPRRPAARAPE